MTYHKLLKESKIKIYNSSFAEAKRNIRTTIKIKVNEDINSLKEMLPDLNKKLHLKKIHKLKINKTNVFVEEFSDKYIKIFYKLSNYFYWKKVKLIGTKKKKLIYTQIIKMDKSPWGIERMFIKKMLRRDMKKIKKDNIKKVFSKIS